MMIAMMCRLCTTALPVTDAVPGSVDAAVIFASVLEESAVNIALDVIVPAVALHCTLTGTLSPAAVRPKA